LNKSPELLEDISDTASSCASDISNEKISVCSSDISTGKTSDCANEDVGVVLKMLNVSPIKRRKNCFMFDIRKQ